MEHSSKGKSSISTHAPLAGRDRKSHSISYVPPVFQPTRPLRGATVKSGIHVSIAHAFQPTRPLRGATACAQRSQSQMSISTHAPLAGRDFFFWVSLKAALISTHAPLAGRDEEPEEESPSKYISTHAPLAGRDRSKTRETKTKRNFNPRAPCGARPEYLRHGHHKKLFQPTRPLRGATNTVKHSITTFQISTHAPLAGRDRQQNEIAKGGSNFNPRAPCGARHHAAAQFIEDKIGFQPTRPLRGATALSRDTLSCRAFQPTRPLRGATRDDFIRDNLRMEFQPTRPLRGATRRSHK